MKADESQTEKTYGDYGNRKRALIAPNFTLSNLAEIKSAYGEPPWEHLLVKTDLMWVAIHCMSPDMRTHLEYHDNSDECWAVLEGEIQWEIEGEGTIRAKPGDFVFVEHGHAHRMTTVSDVPSIRLAFVLPNPDPFAADPSRLGSSTQQQSEDDRLEGREE
jgi:mannose-6-phosphate isomerase-like protein (cupin superfamily)